MLAIQGGKFYTITGGTIDGGVMLVDGGKIKAIGRDVAIPEGATVIEASGKSVAPGFLDCHCHVGIIPEEVDWEYGDVNETTDAVTGHVRAIDGIDFNDRGFRDALEGGVTGMLIHPGSSNVIGGTDIAVKSGGPLEKRVLRNPAGMKMAWSAHGKRGVFKGTKYPYPTTRMGIAGILRTELSKAKKYMEDRAKAEAEGKEPPALEPRDQMTLEVLAKVLRREIPARIHSMTPVDILTILRIKEEFGFDFSVDHGDEAHLIADQLREAGVPVVYGPLIGDREVPMFRNSDRRAPRWLAEKGVLTAFQTDHPVVSIRDLRLQAGISCRYGLPEDEALKMLTINPAKIMGMADRLGSLEPGKDADFSVFSGHPLEVLSKVEAVYIEGEKVFERE